MTALGLVQAAVGSDTGGSVRQPASFCGLVGFKPTYGSISRHGLVSYASSMDTPGILTKSIIDAAIMFDVLSGHDSRDPTSLKTSNQSHKLTPQFLSDISWPQNQKHAPRLSQQQFETILNTKYPNISLKGTTIGLPIEFIVEELDQQARQEFEKSLSMLQDAGATIKQISIPSLKLALPCYYLLACAEASSNLSRYDGVRYGQRFQGNTIESNLSTTNQIAANLHEMISSTRGSYFGPEVIKRILTGTFVLCKGSYDEYYGKAVAVRLLIRKEIEEIYAKEGIDVLASLTTPVLPFPLDNPPDSADMLLNDFLTVPANLAGIPAVSVPVGTCVRHLTDQSQEVLPIGLQLFGKANREFDLLRIALAVEQRAQFKLPTFEI